MSTRRQKQREARARRALEVGRKPLIPARPLTAREAIQYLRDRVSPGPVEPEIEEDDVPVRGRVARGQPDPTAQDEEE